MNTVEQTKLKSKIEKLDKIHQIKILDILIKNQIKYSENRNGVFLNMGSLNNKTIQQKQEKTLSDIENIKQELNQDYFKNGNKETTTYVSNEQ